VNWPSRQLLTQEATDTEHGAIMDFLSVLSNHEPEWQIALSQGPRAATRWCAHRVDDFTPQGLFAGFNILITLPPEARAIANKNATAGEVPSIVFSPEDTEGCGAFSETSWNILLCQDSSVAVDFGNS
jgi:hypothetical protein